MAAGDGMNAEHAGVHMVNSGAARNTVCDEEGELAMSPAKSDATTVTLSPEEKRQVQRANKSGKTPVAFVHGLWLLPSSWDRWAKLFEKAGYVAVTPGWPDDPDTVEAAKAHPEVFAGKSIGQIADHVEGVLSGLDKKPAVIGHSFGGLLTEILAGRGVAAASVVI